MQLRHCPGGQTHLDFHVDPTTPVLSPAYAYTNFSTAQTASPYIPVPLSVLLIHKEWKITCFENIGETSDVEGEQVRYAR